MKEKTKKKNIFTIVFVIICVIIMVVCLVIKQHYKKEKEKLDKEYEILNTLDIKTLSGKTINTEYLKFEESFLIKIPTDFGQMTDDQIKIKYPNGNPPKYVFSNDETNVNVAVGMTETSLNNNQVKEYLKNIEETFKSVFEVIKTSNYEKDGHKIGRISFRSKAIDTDIYNDMLFFSNKGKAVIVTFNTTVELESEWKKVGEFILDSIFFTSDNHE